MLSPVAVVGTDLGVYDPITSTTNMINQSGVTKAFISGSTSFDTYFAVPHQVFATNGGPNNWQSNYTFDLPLAGTVDFDLGDSYTLSKIAVWNISLKEVTVTVHDDLGSPGQVAGDFTLVNHWNYPFSYAVDILNFATPRTGRYVRFSIHSAHLFTVSDTFAYAIVGEVVMSVAPGETAAPLSVTIDAKGDVVVTFIGRLQTATLVDGTYSDVPGNPQGTYTIPKSSLAAQQYFRARGD